MFKNQIIIKVKVNNTDTLNFIFDTGNENAHMDSNTAAFLNLKAVKFQEVHCTGGESIIPVVKCDYSIGNLVFSDIETTTGMLNNYSRILKRRIDGIIGQNLIKDYIVKIDFDSNIIEFRNEKWKYSGKSEAFKIISRGPAIIAEVMLRNGQIIKGEFIIDTGSNSSLTLNSSYTDTSRLNELIGEYKIYTSYDMCGNIQTEYEGKARNLTLGSSQTDVIPTTLSVSSSGVLSGKKYAGLIGTPVLRCFTLIIDSKNNLIYLEPNKSLKEFSRNAKH